MSVYAQHKRHLQSKNDDRDPRDAFMEDFDAELTEWIAQGEQVIIGGDLNDSVFSDRITNLFNKHNMHNLIFTRHNPTNAPATYNRNRNNRVIDGLWGTASLQAERCGYLEPGDFPGDHAALWIDITYEDALGHNPPSPQQPQARRLQLKNPTVTKRYLDKYEELIEQKQLLQRQYRLEDAIHDGEPLKPLQETIANNIDAKKTICMLKAQKKCRKLNMGTVEFSEATAIPIREIAFWDIALKRRCGIKISSKLWRRLKKEAKIIEDTRTMSKEDLILQLKAANRRYRDAKKKDHDSRQSFLDSFPPKIQNRLKRTEAQRKLGRASKLITGKLASKSVTKVEHNGIECTTKQAIEQILFPINENKIRASDDTPFMNYPLLQDFGYQGQSPNIEAVLEGTYEPPHNTDKYSRMFFQAATRPPGVTETAAYISTDEHIKAWNKAKERTSAGISGLHFGMYKAHTKRRKLAEFDASMRSVASMTGFSYIRWRKGIDVQLLKRSKDFRADKLRTILLLEADFNMNNKGIGRDVMWIGTLFKALARDNYGGCKGLRAVEISMNQQLTYDSIWARRGRAVIISNDAKGCYDRIAHVVAIIAMRRLGANKRSLHSMITTIQEMEHYIRTAFGDSTSAYGNDSTKPPPQGMLQGNGAGPASWSSICTIIVQAMKDAGFGYKTWTVISQRALTLICFAFVDDTDLIHATDNPNATTEDLLYEAQEALWTWEGLIHTTGGALAPEKSYWYFIEVVHRDGDWIYRPQDETPFDLRLHNKGQPTTIERLEVSEAKEALGIQIRPDGCMSNEIKYLKEKVKVWCDAIRCKKIQRSEAWYCLNSTIMKTLEYPLMSTTISREDMNDIMAPILRTALPLSGVQRNLPRKLLYGTLQRQGLNIQDPFLTQLIEHLQAILRHCHRQTPSSELHTENMELIQCHVGSSKPFWDLPFHIYGPLAPEGWMKFTWKNLSDTTLSLRGPLKPMPINREHDIHIMDAFAAIPNTTEEILTTLNDCRLHLNATTLAHITTADGKYIHPDAWQGTRPTIHKLHNAWPKTHRPPPIAWTTWQTYLKRTFLQPHNNHKRLQQPLGPWLHADDTEWIWWLDPTNNTIYQRTPTQWNQWTRDEHYTRRMRFLQHNTVNERPVHTQRISVTQHQHALWVNIHSQGTHLPIIPPPINTTLASYLALLPPEAHWAVQHILQTDDGHTLANAIREGYAVAVGDGSLKFNNGTAACILEGRDPTHNITGFTKVPGPVADGDSHRCELAGLYTTALIVKVICDIHRIEDGKITVACDNTYALKAFDVDYLPDPREPNFDLIQAVWQTARTTPVTWNPQHVHGHQDTKKRHHRISRLAKLNIQMDHAAKAFWRYTYIHNNPDDLIICEPPRTIYNEGWTIWDGDTKITQPSRSHLYAAIQDPITQLWWVRHNRIPADTPNDIDWTSTSKTMKQLPQGKRRWVTKHASHNCGVGTTLLQWKMQTDDRCPRCNQQEDTSHVIRCTGNGANEVWNKGIARLATYMATSRTHPLVQTALLDNLQRWRRNELPDHSYDHPLIDRALQQQSAIGWRNFIDGLPSRQWRIIQHRYLQNEQIRGSSKKWIIGLLKNLHELAWDLWQHRNNVKHKTLKPRQTKAIQQLNREVMRIFIAGSRDLPPGDRHHFRHNLATLLQKNTNYKKNWMLNVITAQQRQTRRRLNNNEINTISQQQSTLIRWMKTGRAS